MARLVVVGLPGVGKSSLVLALAALWHCRAVDTDERLAARAGVSAATYLRERGEVAFRALELSVLVEAIRGDTVVATGAGLVTTAEARALLAGEPTLWLDASDAVLLERVQDGDRPLLGVDHADALAALRRQREAWYREVATVHVEATGTLEDVTNRVLERLTSSAP